ncbi:unnamed protein product [Vitrella brassicaformis CCMP3155]|uniref:TLDc domain-containing protein n=1 Tax=Vitrella brassicaformis (strain CCMP3155) TaxID=1169540 RepID=A0A0G4ED38_VITBC|nr:unnamed protein product [Vitrella brassicaformis CCMP3155]|eukprot:CEL93597.1 unnamed protein product [Vitrella brassicaformis CCMP3155]
MDGLRGVLKTAAATAEGEIEQLAAEIKQMITANGGTMQPQQTSGKLKLNVGGTVFSISVHRLLQPKMKQTYLSTLLLHFADQLPKDANQLPFLEAHPPYFRWLRDELAQLEIRDQLRLPESPPADEIALPPLKADNPSYAEYHSLFMQKLGGGIAFEEPPRAAAATAVGGGGEQRDVEMADGSGREGEREGGKGIDEALEKIEQYINNYRRVRQELREQKKAMEAFLAATRPFVKGESSSEDIEVMTLTVEEEDVSVLRRTVAPLGPSHALVKRFDRTQIVGPDQEVRQSPKFLQLIVDFARRLTLMVMPAVRFVHPPVVAVNERAIFSVELGMYGLNTVPPVGGAAGASAVIKTADEWLAVMKMTDKKIATAPSLLYKGSRDTYAFPKMLECVEGKSGLLFALRDGDTHRFGCFIDGEIIPPDDPTKANQYKVPVFFFSLSGAYDAPTMIEIPEERQTVEVAGTQGAAKANNMDWSANVCIACGRMWLGWAEAGPAADLSSCQLWINRDELSEGYSGTINRKGNGTLAQSNNFTASEMEVWQAGGERLIRSDSTHRQRQRPVVCVYGGRRSIAAA